MRRVLSIWLPQWPIERLQRGAARQGPPCASTGPAGPDEGQAFVLTEAGPRGVRITAANPAALALGLQAGLALADARARHPTLVSRPAAPEADSGALCALADWCVQFSPWVNTDQPDGLLIETTGTDHLFGGEAAMLSHIAARLAALGLSYRLGLADTVGAAFAVARFATSARTLTHIVPPLKTADALSALPVEALRLEPNTALLLRRLGLKHIGALYGIPRAALARRFGRSAPSEAVLLRLDQALGRAALPLDPLTPAPSYRAHIAPLAPFITAETVITASKHLIEELCALLACDGKGTRRLVLTAYRADGTLARVTARASRPSRAAAHFFRLIGERLQGLDAGFGIDTLVLSAYDTAPLSHEQTTLMAEDAATEAPVAILVDRLANRLGADKVGRLRPRPSHIPERAEAFCSAMGDGRKEPAEITADASPQTPRRPFRLLPRPEPIAVMAEIPDGPPLRFVWRRTPRRVVKAEGPERIAPEWWRATDQTREAMRDYYIVEDEAGRRYWLFRDGLYGEPDRRGPPQWYVHGFFA